MFAFNAAQCWGIVSDAAEEVETFGSANEFKPLSSLFQFVLFLFFLAHLQLFYFTVSRD